MCGLYCIKFGLVIVWLICLCLDVDLFILCFGILVWIYKFLKILLDKFCLIYRRSYCIIWFLDNYKMSFIYLYNLNLYRNIFSEKILVSLVYV